MNESLLASARRFLEERRHGLETPTALDAYFERFAQRVLDRQPRMDSTIAQLPTLATAATTDLVPVFHNGSTYAVPAGSLPNIAAVGINADFSAVGVFNVRAPIYGAFGNGIADDTVAIQLAINAAYNAGGGTVYLPNGTYLVGQRHLLVASVYTCLELKAGVRLVGQSREGATIKLAASVQACNVAANTGANDCAVSNLTIDGNRTAQTESGQDGNQCGLFIYQCTRPVVHNVTIINAQRQGYYDSISTWANVNGVYAYNCGCEGFSCSNSFYGSYSNIIADTCGGNAATQGAYHSGIYVNGGTLECTFSNIAAQNNASFGFSMNSDSASTDCINNTFIGITTHNNAGGNYIGNSAASTFVSRNRFFNWVSRLDGSASNEGLWLYHANDNAFYGLTVYNAQTAAGVRLTLSSRNRFEDFVTFDDQGVHTQSYGIQEDVDAVNCIENVFLRPYFGGGFVNGNYSLTNSVVQGAVGAPDFYRPTTPTLLNSWTTYGGLTVTVDKDADGTVRFHGAVMGGTIGTNPILTLPVGLRPPSDIYAAVDSNAAFGVVYISSATGNVEALAGSSTYVMLNAIPWYRGT